MTTIGQNAFSPGWSSSDQKRLTELAVAGQLARSGAAQIAGTGDGGPAASAVEKLRTTASYAGSAAPSRQSPEGITSDEPIGNPVTSGGSTEYMRDSLRSGRDGQTTIIEGLEHTLQAVKDNLAYAKQTIDIYEKTGEVFSIQQNGKFKIDLSYYGGKEGYMKLTYQAAEDFEKHTIPSLTKSVEGAKAGRLELLRHYGLAPPAVDIKA